MRSTIAGFVAACLVAAVVTDKSSVAAADPESFRQRVQTLYGFSPHELNEAQIDAKSAELDGFWTMVEGKPAEYLPLLRAELAREGNSPFFYYDGSQLLLSLSEADSDKKLALAAMPRTDLRDLDPVYYLRTIHGLAVQGYDTSEAALHVLDYPDLKAFVVQHYLTLGQDYIFVYLLLPTREEYYLPKVLARVRQETDPVALKSLLRLLWYADTDEADAAIEWAAGAQRLPAEIRQAAAAMVDAANGARSSPGSSTAAEYEALRERRRHRMRSISDEALMELDDMTLRMKGMRK